MFKSQHYLVNKSIAAVALVLALLVLGNAVPAAAEDEPKPVFTRVALWQVERAQWGQFVEFFENYDKPILEKMMNDGLITEWGLDAMSLHKPDGYTHSTWFSAATLGSIEKALDAYMDGFEAMGKENEKRLDAEFASMITKHRDYLLRNDVFQSSKARLDNGYFHGDFVKIKMGKNQAFKSYWTNRIQPVYEKLLADGDIVAFGKSKEEIVTEATGGVVLWYVTATPDGLDMVEEAFEAAWGELDEEGRRARWTSIMDFVEVGAYRSFMSKLLAYGVEAHN